MIFSLLLKLLKLNLFHETLSVMHVDTSNKHQKQRERIQAEETIARLTAEGKLHAHSHGHSHGPGRPSLCRVFIYLFWYFELTGLILPFQEALKAIWMQVKLMPTLIITATVMSMATSTDTATATATSMDTAIATVTVTVIAISVRSFLFKHKHKNGKSYIKANWTFASLGFASLSLPEPSILLEGLIKFSHNYELN